MKIKSFINAKFPTVQYGSIDIGMEIELASEELNIPPGSNPQQISALVGQQARQLLMHEWLQLRNDIEQQHLQKVITLLPPEVEQWLLSTGRIKK